MDIRQFGYLLAIIEAGSLGKAADRLHLSQPALTKSIKRLEQTLGLSLFERHGRGVKPTAYAHHLSGFAKATTSGLSQVLEELSALKEGASGVVTVATPPILASTIVADAVTRLAQTHPGVRVRVLVEIDDLFPRLQTGSCDFVFAMKPNESRRFSGLKETQITNDEMVIVTRPGHLVGRKQIADPHKLVDRAWALPLSGNILRSRLVRIFEDAGLPPPVAAVECQTPDLIKRVVSGTDMLGWVSRLACRNEIASKTLAVSRLQSPLAIRELGVFWRDFYLSPTAALLISAIQTDVREMMSPALI